MYTFELELFGFLCWLLNLLRVSGATAAVESIKGKGGGTLHQTTTSSSTPPFLLRKDVRWSLDVRFLLLPHAHQTERDRLISSHTNVNTITQHSHGGERGEGCKRDEHASNRIDSCETVVLCAYWETADTHSCASSRHRAFLENNNHNNYTVPQSTSLSPQPLTSPSADTRLPGETE